MSWLLFTFKETLTQASQAVTLWTYKSLGVFEVLGWSGRAGSRRGRSGAAPEFVWSGKSGPRPKLRGRDKRFGPSPGSGPSRGTREVQDEPSLGQSPGADWATLTSASTFTRIKK